MLNFQRIAEEDEEPGRIRIQVESGSRRNNLWGRAWRNISILRNPLFDSVVFGRSSRTRESPVVVQPSDMKTAQRWMVALFTIATLLALMVVLFHGVKLKHGELAITLNLEELTERAKCPACFGVQLCPQMIKGDIKLNDWTRYHLTKLVNSKNVFYATWATRAGEKKLVLKKLAHDHELEQLDKEICNRHTDGQFDSCDVTNSVRKLIEKYSHPSQNDPDVSVLHGEKIGKNTDLLQCPSQHKMEYIIQAVSKRSKGPHQSSILAHILTMLLINPEPLILQTFPAEEQWPFPIYYGACGRIVAEEYVGERLTNFYSRDFLVRAKIAVNLLNIAKRLGENESGFVLYLTDPSPDNFAVSEDDYSVKVIDLENLIIVDTSSIPSNADRKLHVGESSKCIGGRSGNKDNQCFSFSPSDLCERPVTDHNFYAICSGLLASAPLSPEFPEGLLHSIPSSISSSAKFSKIEEYLAICNVPVGNLSRREAAEKLLNLLLEYIQES